MNLSYANVFPGESVYNLNVQLVDHNDISIHIGKLSGKIQIVSMIYTRCKTTCPVILENMKNLEKLIPESITRCTFFFGYFRSIKR